MSRRGFHRSKPSGPMDTGFSCCKESPFRSNRPLIDRSIDSEYLDRHEWLTRKWGYGRWDTLPIMIHAVCWLVEQHRLDIGHPWKLVGDLVLPADLRTPNYRKYGLYGLLIHHFDGSNYEAMLFAGYDMEPRVRSVLEHRAIERLGLEYGLRYIQEHPWIRNRKHLWNGDMTRGVQWLADQLKLSEDDPNRIAIGEQKDPFDITRVDLRQNRLAHVLKERGSVTACLELIGVEKLHDPAANLGNYANGKS